MSKRKRKKINIKNKLANTTYTTGTGQKLVNIHPSDKCAGEWCVIHNPKPSHMTEWPTHWRSDRGIMERLCPHGIGHPASEDPKVQLPGEGIHGCDGCCTELHDEVEGCCGWRDSDYYDDGSSAWERGEDDFFDSFFNRNMTKPRRKSKSLFEEMLEASLVKVKRDDPEWVDQDAAPNGIGPTCSYCHKLIDWDPTDHSLDCSRFGNDNGLGE